TAALAGQDDGVDLVKGANGNTVGGGDAARNIIAGYGFIGVFLSDAGTTANVVQGNYVGTDKTGTIKLSSGEKGLDIEGGASGNIIGGRVGTTSDYAGNVLVGNTTDGIRIGG